MKIKALFVGIISLLFGCLSFASDDLNYRHKSLEKALKKAGIENVLCLKEMVLPDSVSKYKQINGKYFLAEDTEANQYQYIYVGRVNSCRSGGCSISNEIPKDGESEYFDYFILFDKSKVVRLVKVFNYQATHGHEVTAKGWLKQFIGHDGSEPLEIDKDIDSISGATISVHAITFDLIKITEILQEI